MFMALGAGPSYQDDGDRLDVIDSVRLKSGPFILKPKAPQK